MSHLLTERLDDEVFALAAMCGTMLAPVLSSAVSAAVIPPLAPAALETNPTQPRRPRWTASATRLPAYASGDDRYSAVVVEGGSSLVSGPTEIGPHSISDAIGEPVGAGTFTPAHREITGNPCRNGGGVNMFGTPGPVRARIGLGASWVDFDAADSSGDRSFDRHEYLVKAGLTLPLTSAAAGSLSRFGDSSIAFDIGRADQGRFGTLTKRSLSYEWQPLDWLQIIASAVRDQRAIAPELLAAPQIVSVNVPYFDPVTGETPDVTTIYGGAAGLRNEDFRTRTLSLTGTPWRKYSLQLDADYIVTDLRNQIGALPLPSAAVVAAFPDRFQRDASGTLILVDNRSVNFARQSGKQLRLAARFVVPLGAAQTVTSARGKRARRAPPLRLQVNASQTILLESKTVIRAGLPEIDLLDGGAVGIAGGQQRHVSNASIALTKGAAGLRIEARRRGRNALAVGTPALPDLLLFEPLATVVLKAITNLGQLFPATAWARGGR